MSMCAPKETIDQINDMLGLIKRIAPLLGLAQVMVIVTLLEAILHIVPVEPLVSEAQLRGGEEHIPGGPIPDPEPEKET